MAHIKQHYEAWQVDSIQQCTACPEIYRAAKPGPRRLCSTCYKEMRDGGLEDERPNAAFQDDPVGCVLWLLDYKPHVLVERLRDYGRTELANEVEVRCARNFPAAVAYGTCVHCGWEWHLDAAGGMRRLCGRCYFSFRTDGTLSSYPIDHFWDNPGEYADWAIWTVGNADGRLVKQALAEYTPWAVRSVGSE